ncbi:hypothetical protein CONPUDRAFT_100023 [Coniophora puteana RWD-64-598 SS2]|uniref:Ras-domain-containing protein n=1 Tax=Coniophora puteana (strain RWD-64-598) TaxID=741705 RepID=A0A5M3MYG2_CONPW|nr:uncharacterized protein CONPUDRAFT_100023 [Coniophora puteana RWD-64-598 SS2]EIW84188.1 hypothetical protein CONPUDRAFT_100023 [Coniophora puteana RWD-64-598 SS2]
MRDFNIVVLGAGGVGKSALTVRFCQDVFLETYDPTIEENYRKVIQVDGTPARLEILDTAGAEQFKGLNEGYIKAGRGFILVYSLTQEASLREIDMLRQQIYAIKGGDTNVPIVVAGTKMDLVNEREVSNDTAQTLSSRWHAPFYETSAKRNWHVTETFEDLVRQMLAKYPHDPKPKKKGHPCIVM